MGAGLHKDAKHRQGSIVGGVNEMGLEVEVPARQQMFARMMEVILQQVERGAVQGD